jgi:hypothetical protein
MIFSSSDRLMRKEMMSDRLLKEKREGAECGLQYKVNF